MQARQRKRGAATVRLAQVAALEQIGSLAGEHNPNGPGLYEIIGVDRATKMDTAWNVRADTRENAKVKGELEGIVVTEVRFVEP